MPHYGEWILPGAHGLVILPALDPSLYYGGSTVTRRQSVKILSKKMTHYFQASSFYTCQQIKERKTTNIGK